MNVISSVLYKVSVFLTALMVATMLTVTLVDVFSRNILGSSFSWSGELSRFLLIWVTFIGASAGYKRLEMPAFDLLSEKVSEKTRDLLFKVIQVLVLTFCGVVAYAGFIESFSTTVQMQKSPGLGLPMTFPYLAIPVGTTLIAIHAIAFLLRRNRNEEAANL